MSDRAGCGRWVTSAFLTVHEQALLRASKPAVPYELTGGAEGCERRMAVFGSEALCGYEFEPPIACVLIEPRNAKFAGQQTHRDYLGALLALGIRRDTLGDIFTDGVRAYVFCTDTVAAFITDNLTEVGRTPVRCAISSPDALPEQRAERLEINVPSERADVVIGAVWKLSRTESAKLFAERRVAIDAVECADPSRQLKPGERASVRGLGKLIYIGEGRSTKKGRLYVTVEKLV